MQFQIYIAILLYVFTVSHAENDNTTMDVDNNEENFTETINKNLENDTVHADNETGYQNNDFNVNEIAETLVLLLIGNNETEKIKELKDKLQKINNYVVDREKYSHFIVSLTKKTDLNETNFFNALSNKDHFSYLSNDSKNLYLRLKEKMNRDDVLKALASRGDSKIMKSARRIMRANHVPKEYNEKDFDDVVDEIIAASPNDDHTFNETDKYNKYWDPQIELEERKNYKKRSGRRIFKGERTSILYYPFVVSIHVMGRFWCGGVLYWHDLVLTTASCLQLMHNNRFFRENPQAVFVRVGSNHSRIGGEMIPALEVYFHPSYNPKTLNHNIAILRLRRHLAFSYHRIPKIIDISHNGEGISFTAEVLLLGWGVRKLTQKMEYEPIFLQRKLLPVYPNVFCKDIYGDKFITRTMFCAGTFTTGEGACDHDAGGPAVLNGQLVGLISFGPTICGYPNTPTVFTLVGAYADWIETINETMPGYYRGKKRTTLMTTFDFPAYLKNMKGFTQYEHSVFETTRGLIDPFDYQPTKEILSGLNVKEEVESPAEAAIAEVIAPLEKAPEEVVHVAPIPEEGTPEIESPPAQIINLVQNPRAVSRAPPEVPMIPPKLRTKKRKLKNGLNIDMN